MKSITMATYPPRQKAALLLPVFLSCLIGAGLLMYGPIPQDGLYHAFADQRTLFNTPNFWNVFSNLPFLMVGLVGLYRCKDISDMHEQENNKTCYMIFFTGVMLTGLGSMYYHLQPDNWGLFWDRLAMSICFMAFFSIIITNYFNPKTDHKLLIPLVLFGIFSTLYWIISEQNGSGDLRLYVAVQFLPILIIPGIVMTWRSTSIRTRDILIIGGGYGLAKLFEFLDIQIYQAVSLSGHSLKHLAAAFSAYWVLIVMQNNHFPVRPTRNIFQKRRNK